MARQFARCFLVILFCALISFGQSHSKEIGIPKELLNQLMRDDAEVRMMLREGYDPEIHRFSVDLVDLNGDSKPEFIVTAPGGNSSAPIWIYPRTPKGYRQILKAAFMDYSVLKTSANGYRDLEMIYGENAEIEDVFKFDGKRYILKSSRKRRM